MLIESFLRWSARSGLVILFVITSLGFAQTSLAQGEHSRRIGAELAVIAGDIRQLQSGFAEPLQARGLRQRALGALVGLDILTRLADQESSRVPLSRTVEIDTIRSALKTNQLTEALATVNSLQSIYPLNLPDIDESDLAVYANLHQTLCFGCHDDPDLNVERPAYNLAAQVRVTPSGEMFARMLVGVRGDAVTGIDNPLTDRQIIGLLNYYKQVGEQSTH